MRQYQFISPCPSTHEEEEAGSYERWCTGGRRHIELLTNQSGEDHPPAEPRTVTMDSWPRLPHKPGMVTEEGQRGEEEEEE